MNPLLTQRVAVVTIALLCAQPLLAQDPYARPRAEMIQAIGDMVRLTAVETGRPQLSSRVMLALERVPRHEFVPRQLAGFAYLNRPLPIGEGQTISQPYIVALMSDLLEVKPGERVLEVGTGSGYQAAVLAEMGIRVWSIEIIESLATSARERLARLGYHNVRVRAGDGYGGWPGEAPFHGIIVTAAAPHVPQPLVEQLAPGGRLVIPVGPEGGAQQLLAIEKDEQGRLHTQQVLPVRFVPLTGDH